VKLLFDENLSIALPQTLADLYPDSAHVFDLGLGGKADLRIWERAAADGLSS
jgi:predicted nuclease of predicted toxin-antitoxin system